MRSNNKNYIFSILKTGPFRGADDTMANLERIRPLSISRRLVL